MHDSGLSEWRETRRALSWRNRWLLHRAVSTGRPAPVQLAQPGTELAEGRADGCHQALDRAWWRMLPALIPLYVVLTLSQWDELPWVGGHPSWAGRSFLVSCLALVLASLFERPRLRRRLSKAEQSLAATRRMLQRT